MVIVTVVKNWTHKSAILKGAKGPEGAHFGRILVIVTVVRNWTPKSAIIKGEKGPEGAHFSGGT